MKLSNKILIGFISIVLILIPCFLIAVRLNLNPIEYINGNGQMKTEDRTIEPFTSLSTHGKWININLIQSDEAKIQVKAEENILPKLNTFVKDGRLLINLEDNTQPSKEIHIDLYFNELEEFAIGHRSKLVADSTLRFEKVRLSVMHSAEARLNLTASQLDYYGSQSGKAILRGNVDWLLVELNNSANLDALDLIANDVNAKTSNSARLKVHALEKLSGWANNTSSVRYKGDPKIALSTNRNSVLEAIKE